LKSENGLPWGKGRPHDGKGSGLARGYGDPLRGGGGISKAT